MKIVLIEAATASVIYQQVTEPENPTETFNTLPAAAMSNPTGSTYRLALHQNGHTFPIHLESVDMRMLVGVANGIQVRPKSAPAVG